MHVHCYRFANERVGPLDVNPYSPFACIQLGILPRCDRSSLQCAGGGEGAASEAVGLEGVKGELLSHLPAGPRPVQGPFLFAIDHCFAIRGQGTVMTGTVMQALRLPVFGTPHKAHVP